MNLTTEEVLEFLNFPDLDLGTNPLDLEMLQTPALTRGLTTRLLSGPLPSDESRAAALALKGRLDDADWSIISQALRERFRLTDALFDTSGEAGTAYDAN
jgi:hypothetical protein